MGDILHVLVFYLYERKGEREWIRQKKRQKDKIQRRKENLIENGWDLQLYLSNDYRLAVKNDDACGTWKNIINASAYFLTYYIRDVKNEPFSMRLYL